MSTSYALAAPLLTHEATGSISTTTTAPVVTPATLTGVTTISGTVTNASSVTVNVGSDIVFNPSGSIRVTLPAATVITPATGTGFDTTAIISSGAVVTTGLAANEVSNGAVEFGISTVGLNFSVPIKIEIPVPGYTSSTIAVKVKHGGTSTYVTTGLTNDPNTSCSSGVPLIASNVATVTSGVATIYTCAASTFVAVSTPVVTPTYSGGGGGGGAYIVLPTSTNLVTNTTTPTVTPIKKTPVRKILVRKTPIKKTPVVGQEDEVKVTPVYQKITAKNLYTNASRVNIYVAADSKSKFIGYFTKNIRVSVLEQNGEWIKVTTASFSGWAKASQFRMPTWAESKKILKDADKLIPYVLYTNKGRVNVRLAGDKTAKFLGYFGNNTKVEVIGTSVEWLNITSKYLTGWSKKEDFREPTEKEDSTIKIVK
jgi:SH3-like domain-containing protein